MSDLISRQALCEYALNQKDKSITPNEIMRFPSAEPVRHGKWIPCAKSGLILSEQMRREGIRWYGFKCSACNYVRKGNALREANYCPNCGARMDAE